MQADRFAASLLMPEEMVRAACRQQLGSLDPIRFAVPTRPSSEEETVTIPSDETRLMRKLEELAEPFAGRFRVSVPTMRIGLHQLGLLGPDRDW